MVKGLYNLVNHHRRNISNNIGNIKLFHDIQNFKNYEKCANIVNNHQFIFKRHYKYPYENNLSSIFYHFCKHGYVDELVMMIMHEDCETVHILEIKDKIDHPEKYGYDNYDIVDKNKFISEMQDMLSRELDTDDIKYTLSLNTLRFALIEYGFKQNNKKVVKLLLSLGTPDSPFGCNRWALYTDEIAQTMPQMYKWISTISKNGGSRAITTDELCRRSKL